MKKTAFFSLCLVFFFSLKAQDAYHTNLLNELQTEYSLPSGDWVFFDTENAILYDANQYGCSFSLQDEGDQAFSRKVRLTVNVTGNNVVTLIVAKVSAGVQGSGLEVVSINSKGLLFFLM